MNYQVTNTDIQAKLSTAVESKPANIPVLPRHKLVGSSSDSEEMFKMFLGNF